LTFPSLHLRESALKPSAWTSPTCPSKYCSWIISSVEEDDLPQEEKAAAKITINILNLNNLNIFIP
jgi:hypothetical protein